MRNTFDVGSTAAIVRQRGVQFVEVIRKDGRGCVTVMVPETRAVTHWNARTGREWGTGNRRYSMYASHLVSEADGNLRIAHNEQRSRMESTVQEVNKLLDSIKRMSVYWSPEEGKTALDAVIQSVADVAEKLEVINDRNTF